MKHRKRQRSKQRCPDLGWKVQDRAQSFVLPSYIMRELQNQLTFLLVTSSVRSKQLWCLYKSVHGQGQKREQKHTTKKFVGFHNCTSPLTMV